ncbi:DUF7837 family putative zinc-binding protein [Halalkaliarchaeum desulfuricum]
MSQATASLGTCPLCGTRVSRDAVLIEYEVDGDPRLFAECPECEQPVRPQ